ncbi:DUF6188 family protein [Rhodococcus sp. 1168]|uniref:DUF6188 family protein n=1 Tax=Rhodococcus sp. 1168 TaxID=2018041 RepID=UPI000A0E343E|nr:hypothetical protein BJI47_17005 [Rhodococcus sp. 1168]
MDAIAGRTESRTLSLLLTFRSSPTVRSQFRRVGSVQIPLVAQTVVTVDFGFSFLLVTSGGFEIRIESTFRVDDSQAGRFEGVPDEELSSNPAFRDLIGKAIEDAHAAVDGTLTLLLSGHTTLTVPADPDFEAWTVAGPGGNEGRQRSRRGTGNVEHRSVGNIGVARPPVCDVSGSPSLT